MGVVYKARDTKLGREVAPKILPEQFARDPERMARFSREARLLASLNHPHIASIYGLEEQDGIHALAMELVEGTTLADRIALGAIPQEEALGLGRQIAEALGYAHENGFVHRDLKPANVKVTGDGAVKLLDFGLAKHAVPREGAGETATLETLTESGMIVGTIAYISPDQAQGKPVDARSDVFSTGAVLYEMLWGKRPFSRDTQLETLAAILRDSPQPPEQIRVGIGNILSADEARCSPEKRPCASSGKRRNRRVQQRGRRGHTRPARPICPWAV